MTATTIHTMKNAEAVMDDSQINMVVPVPTELHVSTASNDQLGFLLVLTAQIDISEGD